MIYKICLGKKDITQIIIEKVFIVILFISSIRGHQWRTIRSTYVTLSSGLLVQSTEYRGRYGGTTVRDILEFYLSNSLSLLSSAIYIW